MNKLIISISLIILASFIPTSDAIDCIIQATAASTISGTAVTCTTTGSITWTGCFVQYTNATGSAGYISGCSLATSNAAIAATGGQPANPAAPACPSVLATTTTTGTLTNTVCLQNQASANNGLTAAQLQAAVSTTAAVTSCYVQASAVSTSAAYYTAQACTGTNLFCAISQTFVSSGVWSYTGACAATCTALTAPTSGSTALVTACCSTNNCNVPNALSTTSTTTTTTTTTVKSSAITLNFAKYVTFLMALVAVLIR